jgi:hypothetical protein
MDICPLLPSMVIPMRLDLQISTLIVATMMLASTAALGDTGRYAATLAQPLAGKKEFIVNGNLFRCEGSTCVLASNPVDAGTVRSCRAVQREVGTLTAYVADGKPFDADKLAKCNSPT